MLKGITVTLYTKTQTGKDAFNRPVYTEQAVQVDNVLVSPASTSETLETVNLTGKKAVYTLGIPKGDNHDWKDKKISWTDAYGVTHVCKTFGFPITGIEANIPTRWHMKVRCEDYE